MGKINHQKAKLLYDTIDTSSLYNNPVDTAYRSIMNVPFFTGDAELDKRFVAEAKDAGLLALKGHREVGGMRASIYNAISMDAVKALCDFMRDFESRV